MEAGIELSLYVIMGIGDKKRNAFHVNPLFRGTNIQVFEISSVETSIPGNQLVSLNLSVSPY